MESIQQLLATGGMPVREDGTSVFMMRGPSYRGKGLDTFSVEAVPQASRHRGTQPPAM